MNLNRHHRRRAQASRRAWLRGLQKLHNAARVADGSAWALDLRVHPVEQLLIQRDPTIMRLLIEWADRIPTAHPKCLTCEHEWYTRGGLPPAAFAFTRPWDESKSSVVMLSAICDECFFGRSNLAADVETAMRRLWPDAQFSDPSATLS